MQNLKGVITFFTSVLIFVCLIQLSFTFSARYVEGKADDYANSLVKVQEPAGLTPAQKIEFQDSVENIIKSHRRNYLDSVDALPIIDVWGIKDFYTYKFCHDHALSLGLDLKGGMSLTMEISEDDVLRSLSYNSRNQQFNKAIENAKAKKKDDQRDFLSIFKDEFEALNKDAKLAAIFSPIDAYQNKITVTSSNDEVINVLRKDMESAVKNTFNVLKTRIDQFGVASPNISLQEGTGRIVLELPGVDDPKRVRKLLQQTAQLEFWNTYETSEVGDFIFKADEVLGTALALEAEAKDTIANTGGLLSDTTISEGQKLLGDTTTAAVADSAAIAAKDSADKRTFPLLKILQLNTVQEGRAWGEGSMVGVAMGKDTAKINRLLARPEVKTIFPRELRLLWGARPFSKTGNAFGLYAIKYNPSTNKAPLTGEVIKDAYQDYDQGQLAVSMVMDGSGASTWERMTEAASNSMVNGKAVKKCIAIVLDDRVFSSPQVRGKIPGGRSQITGLDDLEEANDLANILKSGKLEARTVVIEEQVIGPSLGKESIRAGLLSLVIGFAMVFLFMLLYYSTSGAIANVAMLLNLFILVCTLIGMGASFTLAAMAGILLTLAMAVDANVIINERIREEVLRGKGLRLAVDEGFSHSYNAIVDGNLTTMVVGIVLIAFGLGPIKGFGVVLVAGLFTSMFTAVLVSRVIFDYAFSKNWNVQFGNKFTMNLFKNLHFDFMGKRKITYTISAIVISVSILSMVFYGFDLGVDFKGGRSYVISFDKNVTTEEVAGALEKTLDGAPQVKTYGSANQVSVTTAYRIEEEDASTDSIVEATVYAGVKPLFIAAPTFDDFRVKNIKSSIKIGSSIADDIRTSAFWAFFLGLAGVFVYILIRFKRYEYATGAIVALIHDPIIVLGIFSLFRKIMPFSLEVDQTIVAAVLTLIGYSVNDTVIVFDRIRETIGLHPTRTIIQNTNDSINQTLSRTIMTVATVFLVALVLFLFGGTPIRGFSFALIIGLLIGTFSSIFVASPIMVDLMSRKKKA